MVRGVSGRYLPSLGLLCWFFLAIPSVAQASQADQAECLFNWAEKNYASLFAPSGTPTVIAPNDSYRHYSATNANLRVSTVDNHVYYQGQDGAEQDVGALSDWLPKAGCALPPSLPECLFNWAERDYAYLFSPAGSPTAVWDVYTYRHYPATSAYLGVSYVDYHAYYLGPDGAMQDEGPLSDWTAKACRSPFANAGADQTALVGATVTLDASASTDPDGNAITYQWTLIQKPAISQANLLNPTALHPALAIDKPGTYAISLIVNDGQFDSAPSTVTINTQNSKPVANAGPDQTVPVGATVQIDGSGSTDVDGDPLNFSWAIIGTPSGSQASPSSANQPKISFKIDKPGVYRIQLVVNDGLVNSVEDIATVSTLNTKPVANAGANLSAPIGKPITLNGIGSTDVDGDPLAYLWSLTAKPADSLAQLSDLSIVNPSLTLDQPGHYVAQLIVNDSHVDSEPSTVDITTENSKPVANAGPDQTAKVNDTVALDGSGSKDADHDALTFLWSLTFQPMGSLAQLDNPTLVKPHLVLDLPGSYIAQLIVNDGKLASDPGTVTITTTNSQPVAHAGINQNVSQHDTVQLDGSGSRDADKDALTYRWALLSRPTESSATLSDATIQKPSFIADQPGTYVAQLIVNDGHVDSVPATVGIEAANVNDPPKITSQPITKGTEAQTYSYQVTATDANSDTLAYSLPTAPSGMTINASTGLIQWTMPASGGPFAVTVNVADGNGGTSTQSFQVALNHNPQITSQPTTLTIVGQAYSYQVTATDADGNTLTYSLPTAPSGMTINASTGLIQWPQPTLGGPFNVTVLVSDGNGGTASQQFTLTVAISNNPPIANAGDAQSVGVNSAVQLNGSLSSDPDNNPLTYRWSFTLKPDQSQAALGQANSVTPSFVPDVAGIYQVQLLVNDGMVDSAPATTSVSAIASKPPAASFVLSAPQAKAEALPGQSVSFSLQLDSTDGFKQLADISVAGLPANAQATLKPQMLGVGQTGVLTVDLDATTTPGDYPVTVTAQAEVNGVQRTSSVNLTAQVMPITTSFVGRTVVDDNLQTPLAGVTVQFLGVDGSGNSTGCHAMTVSDAVGNFTLTNLPDACAGKQLIRYNGLTATAPPGKYSGVDLFYELALGQATTSPVLIHLPRLDDKETVMVQQDADHDQTFTFNTIPNLKVTVYAGTTFKLVDGTQPDPFPLIAIQVPIDRLPDTMPPMPNELMAFIVAFQPANATASQPVAVFFPNTLNTPPATHVELSTLDPTKGVMVMYGTGVVSDDGTQIIPDFDPNYAGRRYGLVHFDWHGPVTPPNPVNPCPSGTCCTLAGKPVDMSSGIETIHETDIAINGPRGTLAVERNFRTMSGSVGAFGLGGSNNFEYRLNTNDLSGNGVVMSLIMPDGNQFQFVKQKNGLWINPTIASLQGAVMKVNGGAKLRWKDGTTYTFQPISARRESPLASITDANGNTITLNRNGAGFVSEAIDPVGRKLSFNYDASNRIIDITDPMGRIVKYTYNAKGVLETFTNTEGGVTRYEYVNHTSDLKSVIDPKGVVIAENTYGIYDRVIEQKRPDGTILKFRYKLLDSFLPGCENFLDSDFPKPITASNSINQNNPLSNWLLTTLTGKQALAGNPPSGGGMPIEQCYPTPNSPVIFTKMIDARGNTTIYRFNPQGILLDVTDPMGQTRIFGHDSKGQVTAIKGNGMCPSCGDPANGDQSFTYDDYGNRTSMTDALGKTTTYAYTSPLDDDGLPKFQRVEKVTDPLGNETRYTYDSKGNLLSVTDANGHKTSMEYNEFGQVKSVIDPLGQTTAMSYDNYGNVATTTDPLGNQTVLHYDAISRPVETIDALGHSSKVTYDRLGRVTATTDPQGGTTQFAYDANNNLMALTDALGRVTSFSYDSMNRLTRRDTPLGKFDTRQYDANGNLSQFTDRRGQTATFIYDSVNMLTEERYTDAKVKRVYDAAGRLSEVRDSASGDFAFDYDAVGRLLRAVSPTGVVDYTHDDLGRTLTRQVAGQPAVNYAYDPLGNLSAATMLTHSLNFSYDPRNQPTTVQRSNGVNSNYSFDPAGRLLTLVHQNGANVLNTQNYQYDEISNRTRFDNDIAQALTTPPVKNSFNEANQLLTSGDKTYQYDGNGNLTAEISPAGRTDYRWDARNRLASIKQPSGETLSFVYDYTGMMLTQFDNLGTTTTSRSYVLDDLTNVTYAFDQTGTGQSYLTGRGIDQHFASVSANGKALHALTDAINSTVATVDENGLMNGQFYYEPYGQTTASGDYLFQYTGRVPVVGNLYYYRARFYDAGIGRFLSEYPIEQNTYIESLYKYANNAPIIYIDPAGLSPNKNNWHGFYKQFYKPTWDISCKDNNETCETAIAKVLINLMILIGEVSSGNWRLTHGLQAFNPGHQQRIDETADRLETCIDEAIEKCKCEGKSNLLNNMYQSIKGAITNFGVGPYIPTGKVP